jgi:antirestriction protein
MSQDMINMIIGGAGGVIGWFLKSLWESVRELERDLHTNYVSKVDYRADILEMKDILKQIFNKLDNKADKA